MKEKRIPDDQLEAEIARLRGSEAVKLALKYDRYRNRRRQYLYRLQNLERIGWKLMDMGVTAETLEEFADEEVGAGCS